MKLLAMKLEGNKGELQFIQILVPLRHLSLNLNVCGLRRCPRVGYSDKELPFEETIFLDTWDINSSKD
jgi:hypothetical protein